MQPTQKLVQQPGCVERSLAIIGDKWTGLIVRELADSPKRFSELERTLVGISPRTLSQRLTSMEEAHIVTKETCPTPTSDCSKYSLTQKGQDLLPILQQMAAWGQKYHA